MQRPASSRTVALVAACVFLSGCGLFANAWFGWLEIGVVNTRTKSGSHHVWPVRGEE